MVAAEDGPPVAAELGHYPLDLYARLDWESAAIWHPAVRPGRRLVAGTFRTPNLPIHTGVFQALGALGAEQQKVDAKARRRAPNAYACSPNTSAMNASQADVMSREIGGMTCRRNCRKTSGC